MTENNGPSDPQQPQNPNQPMQPQQFPQQQQQQQQQHQHQPHLAPPSGPGAPLPGQYVQPPQGGGVNKKAVLAVIGVLVLIIGGIIAAVLLTGGSDDDGDSANADGPVATVEAVIAALEEGDCDAAREHAPQLDDATCQSLAPEGFEYGDVTEGESADEQATVHVAIESPESPEPLDVEVSLEKDGDDWQVVNWTDPREGTPPPCSDGAPACTPDPSPTQDLTSPDPSSGDGTDPAKAEVLAVAQSSIDALGARDCEALLETTLDPNADCDSIFAEIPENLTFGTIQSPIGDEENTFVQVDTVVDGQSFPRGMQLRMQNQDGTWLVMSWQYFN
ncbi:hypothetical protein ASG90_14180 [Nocardioides sp. Soil797]|nr:hypothetical protein ASG90_14180 [Nocardioides sp. Soil797]